MKIKYLNDLIILDNSPLAYSFDNDNGLPIKAWYEDRDDSELEKVYLLLEFLSKVKDVRNFIKKFVNNNEIDYEASNEIIKLYNENMKDFNHNNNNYMNKSKELKEKENEKILSHINNKENIPAFILIMASVFWLTFNVIGAALQNLLEMGIDVLTGRVDQLLNALNVNETIHHLLIEGVFAGVGSVLSFLPIIVTLFFFLSLMEDSGYIARVAFVMDKLLRKIGLSGRSIVPMLIGFGCSVPAIMSTRTLPSERDRKMTILLIPFMSCSAKLPIYAFFVNAFFPKRGALIMTGLYVLGILLSILIARIYKNTLFKGSAAPFVMELPNYRIPSAQNVIRLLWEKAKDFLQSFDLHFNLTQDSHSSILAFLSGGLVPLFKPIGLGDWRIVTSLISGVMAKESVTSTMEVLFGQDLSTILTPLAAASMLVFSLLYTPCIAAIAAVKREMGHRWAISVVLWQCAVAWMAAYAVRIIGLAIGMR